MDDGICLKSCINQLYSVFQEYPFDLRKPVLRNEGGIGHSICHTKLLVFILAIFVIW